MRLDKYLCECNIASRSEVKKIIKAGRIKVEGAMVKSPQFQLDEQNDSVMMDDKEIIYQKFRYYLLNKPAGYVTAVKDNLHKTVMDILKEENVKDCFPVGRLDIDTEGLLLITNDGQLSHKLLSPAHHVPKRYFVRLDQPCKAEVEEVFQSGVDIGDDEVTKPAILEICDDAKQVYITITEGRFHQIKRMFFKVGYNVEYLRRESMGGLTLGSLKVGDYKMLSTEDMKIVTEILKC